jgi:hypothetical protein
MAVRFAALYPQGRFLVLISGRIRSIEISNYLIGNRIRDLPKSKGAVIPEGI